jgi:(2Fe-2S) ferredoxin
MKTIYTVHVNGVARYHGIRREDAQDIAWAHLLNGEKVEVQENPWESQ